MVIAGKVKDAVQYEDLKLRRESMLRLLGLPCSGFDRDGEIAGHTLAPGQNRRRREREDIGGFILAAEPMIQFANLVIRREQNGDFAAKLCGFCGLLQKRGKRAASQGPPEFGFYRRFGNDHGRVRPAAQVIRRAHKQHRRVSPPSRIHVNAADTGSSQTSGKSPHSRNA